MRVLAPKTGDFVTDHHRPPVRHSVPAPVTSLPAPQNDGAVLQRKSNCACGGGCPGCADEAQTLGIQTKLAVSTPGDHFEREADAVADQVMRMPEPQVQRQCNSCADAAAGEQEPAISRQANDNSRSGAVAPDFTNKIGGGVPLDSTSRNYFEPRFGRDFSSVRVHVDAPAAASAAAINARAFTLGNDVVFGAGEWSPGTIAGQRLLAHELAHVVQQRSTSPPAQVQRQAASSSPAPVAGALAATVSLSGGYATSRDAAFAALTLCNPKSILSGERPGMVYGLEYGGLIYTLGGKFFFTEPIEGEEGHVDVWRALSQVPAVARGDGKTRGSIVGDYHTHGSGKTASGRVTGEGEEFSGVHADAISQMLPSLAEKADIGGTIKDVATRTEIMDPKTYTAYLGTPQGRFALFIPGQSLVFSFSPDSRLLPLDPKIPSGAAIDDSPLVVMSENGRQKILDAAIAKLMRLQNRMLDDDPALKAFDPSKPNSGIDPEDSKTIRTISREMAVYPNSLDWLHDKTADRFFEVLRILTILYLENRNLRKSHVVKSGGVCGQRGTMARAETPMLLCRAFFDIGKEYSDNWCPGLILTHEYFHYLNEPRSGAHIQHADNIAMMAADWERRIADAYSLSGLAVQLALGREVSCELETSSQGAGNP